LSDAEHDPFRRARLILDLRQAGITENALLNAIESIPRDRFVPAEFAEHAYEDVALPIACGQTTSRPTTVAGIVNALELGANRDFTILEIGTGSGFMTALMARLARRVYTVERYRTLTEDARKRFEELGLFNVISQSSDGSKGWPETAPFDRIVSTCAVEDVPDVWLDQLKPGGIMVLPIGTNEEQSVVQIRKVASGKTETQPLAPSKFLHLVEGVAKQL
jgi:protein-L-isoaspartate(D-aspartate) O-methyltransferase